jgi:ribosomal protein L22
MTDEIKPKVEEKKIEEVKATETKVEAKPEKPAKVKKEEAIALGNNLHISMKEGRFICKFILGKTIDKSISDLQDVLKMKRVIPMTGEIPHRSEPGVMSGRYPQTASKVIISILKGLKGNAIANGMDLDDTRISAASSSFASRPSKRGGGTFKRANIIIKAKEGAKK